MDHTIIRYLTIKRTFIFFDEWLSYFTLYMLWHSSYYYLFTPAVFLAIFANGYAYHCYWKMEDKYNDYIVSIINKESKKLN